MKCRVCGCEIVFVRSIPPRADVWNSRPTWGAYHVPVNLHDADLFGAGAKAGEPSRSYQYKLRAELEKFCRQGY